MVQNLNDRRDEEHSRREEDRRWEKFQEQIMNLVTSQVTNQQALAALEGEFEDIKEHVGSVDTFLRGGEHPDHHSLETRLAMAERGVTQSEVILRQVMKQMAGFKDALEVQKSDLSHMKISQSLTEKSDATKAERFKTWLGFWGPIILAGLALVLPLSKEIFANWDKVTAAFHKDTRPPVEVAEEEIKVERKRRGGAKKIRKEMIERYGPDAVN